MKKLYLLLFISLAFTAFGQEKYALVIGNSHYSNFGTLQNPVNDANDMANALRNLGFKVDLVQDATLTQMENSVIGLRNHLSDAGNDSIGFFYYAGHGVEKDGVNYLIPADANIPDSLFLRERAFSVQIMLDALNDSRNALNIVVLDACRDFPASWSRSLDRGLAIITDPPANHIIMYATGAGKVANDGSGRNGLFTGYLLNNLRQHYDINEIFRKTMADVAAASNNEQRPALYTDFAQTWYFDSTQTPTEAATVQPPSAQAAEPAVNTLSPQELAVIQWKPTGFWGGSLSAQNIQNIRDAEDAGLTEIKLRITRGEDPLIINPTLLQGIQDEQSRQKTRSVLGWTGFGIGMGLMASSLLPLLLNTDKLDDKNFSKNGPPVFTTMGILLVSGLVVGIAVPMHFQNQYDQGTYKIANLRSQYMYASGSR